jgi:predicted SAM-dependent methyltransferase
MECILCNNKITEWKTYSSRVNVGCPYCNSAERHRLTALFLKLENINYNNFLHIAPELPLQNIFKSYSNNYICGDINPERYKKLGAIYLDATDIQYKENYFDCVYASHILEHIIEDKKAISEIFRTLKPGGKLITMVPLLWNRTTYYDPTIVTPEERKKAFGQWDHVRIYGTDFSTILKEQGFYIKVYYLKEKEKDIQKIFYDEKHIINIDNIENNTNVVIPKNNRTKYNLSVSDVLFVCIKQ